MPSYILQCNDYTCRRSTGQRGNHVPRPEMRTAISVVQMVVVAGSRMRTDASYLGHRLCVNDLIGKYSKVALNSVFNHPGVNDNPQERPASGPPSGFLLKSDAASIAYRAIQIKLTSPQSSALRVCWADATIAGQRKDLMQADDDVVTIDTDDCLMKR